MAEVIERDGHLCRQTGIPETVAVDQTSDTNVARMLAQRRQCAPALEGRFSRVRHDRVEMIARP